MDKSKVVSIEDRIPKIKKERRRKANRKMIFIITMFFLLIGCIIYFQSPLSHVQTIEVNGNDLVTEKEIIAQSGLSSKVNIWTIDETEIEKKIKEIDQIENVSVTIKWPNNITIDISEWRRVAYYKNDLEFFPILENGEMLNKKEESIPVHAPILFEFDGGQALEMMVRELIKLPQEVVRSISEIYLTPTDTDSYSLTVYMNDGFEVKATIRTFSKKMVHYPSIVSQLDPSIKGYVDLTVGAYFRPYETDETEGEDQELILNENEASQEGNDEEDESEG
ncbi:MAG TPA: cell division protein FtsQ/DivIB [Bacillus sp. (in: firmicutes)]|uniref:cell division protein FtsQ/DivIB n=1 Tax=Bacillus litorisediminis TaxID=2922713 RepID=UPI001FAB65BA|nr:cell division protein FtsQ/DivIB [Bacillus litorisediminis]HWO77864.1 cell division protein FtsQ/DivIB [Bacillus sp. (in: firmicutes)]